MRSLTLLACIALLALSAETSAAPAPATSESAAARLSYNQDIRPILSNKCFACHGPDAKAVEAELRLDLRDDALAPAESGKLAIVPGDADASELIARVESSDPDEHMPPRKSHKSIRKGEIAKLRRWIAEGAEYEAHWAFIAVEKPQAPKVKNGAWPQTAIDPYILSRLEREKLSPAGRADRATLLRRVTLDLTGLPPTPDEVGAFLDDPVPFAEAYGRVVDRLLASPNYGEHLAWHWLDQARYADSDGYESDPLRNMWPWRDWVVEAFNRNLPYDQFIVEQLAGDLLPDPDLRQLLATGFNRNHRLNNEGGIDPEEWLIEYVADRAETTATVFMGLTWQCARCHDHKFDPITAKNYYQMFAFFHKVPENGRGVGGRDAPPMIEVSALDDLERFAALQAELAPLRTQLAAHRKQKDFKTAQQAWMESLKTDQAARKKLPGDLAKKPLDKWDAKLKGQAETHFLNTAYAPARELRQTMAPLEAEERRLKSGGAKVMIMGEMDTPRQTHLLERGQFDRPGEVVTAATPTFLPAMNESLPRNRLGLARWLVDPSHPLTARVAVNRLWERFFGIGLVKTQEDFGMQGEPPFHPQLLDFLAWQFMDSGWDLKVLQKLIVTSATYLQSSTAPAELLVRDPDNRLLARGPRYRLPAPVIRDQALAACGLLVNQLGGPPVKPYQPEGLWREIIKGRVEYKRDSGDKLYRRSLYTLWRRAVKPPLMMLLDSNGRDVCAVNQRRTNTPLQALLLMNDETFVEMARALGERMLREGGAIDKGRLDHGWLLVTGRHPSREEYTILRDELNAQRLHFAEQPEAAAQLVAVGESKPDASLEVPAPELAAWTSVARVLLNLDETLMKE